MSVVAAEKPVARTQWSRWWVWLGAGLIILAIAVWLRAPLPPPKVTGYTRITNDAREKDHLVTDGARLYFNETVAIGQALVQVSAAGGETAQISAPFQHPELFDMSPNRSALLVGGVVRDEPNVPLWVIPIPAGTPRRLGDVRAHGATWSPDGRQIAYANGPDIFLANNDGTGARKLTSVAGTPFMLRWSPDGRVLRFSVEESKTNSHSLWEVSADGSRLRPLLAGWSKPPSECCGNWTPDGKYFLIESRHNGVRNVWAVPDKEGSFRKTTSQPVLLTSGTMSFASPVSSNDGKKLFVIGEQRRGELVRYDSKSRQFVPYLSGISAEGVSFSKDGAWVAYVAYPEGTLWRSKLDGSERLQLCFEPMSAFLPQWSPDGRRIAFIGITPGKPWQIYMVSPEGGTPERLTADDKNHGSDSWSPDGNSLAFGDFNANAIHILDLRTRRVSTVPGSQGLWGPHWSPSGRYLEAKTSDNTKVMGFDFNTGKWTEWAKVDVVFWVNWSRDGKSLYFDSTLGSEPTFYRLQINTHKLERLVSLKELGRQARGLNAPWTGLAPDDSPLALRDIGSQEIYALDWEAP